MVAFCSDELHRVNGKGNWNPAPKEYWLPLTLASFIGSTAKATENKPRRCNGCLLLRRVSSGPRQRQLKSSSEGVLVAFGSDELHRVYGKGN